MSGPDASPGSRLARGFTLVEILVVVLIIGLLFSVVLLSINPNTREKRLEKEAARVWRLLSLVSEESVLHSREYGLRVAETGYRFYGLQGEDWVPVTDDKRLRERTLPDFVRPEVYIDGLRIVLDETPTSSKPQVMMLSSGELIPDFALLLRDRESDRTYRIGPTEDTDIAMRLERE